MATRKISQENQESQALKLVLKFQIEQSLAADIVAANDKLDHVRIVLQDGWFYLRGTFPAKDGKGRKNQRIPARSRVTLQGLKVAIAKARKLDGDLAMNRFDWHDWLTISATEVLPYSRKAKGQRTIGEWIKLFEIAYWQRRQKTVSRHDNFKTDYLSVFKFLDADEVISEQVLEACILDNSPPDTRQRQRFCNAMRVLGKFAALDCNFTQYIGKYTPVARIIPSEKELEAAIDALGLVDGDWQYVAGLLATFGIRPHELFHLNTNKLTTDLPVLGVKKETKTGERIVLPCRLDWIDRWHLHDCRFPFKEINPNLSNHQLGGKISCNLKKRGFPYTPYVLRDMYGIRCELNGIGTATAAKLMGHSEVTHNRFYINPHFSDSLIIESWRKAFQRQEAKGIDIENG